MAAAVRAEIYVVHFNIRRTPGNIPIPGSSGLLLLALLARHGSLLFRVSLIRLISRFTAAIYPAAVSLFVLFPVSSLFLRFCQTSTVCFRSHVANATPVSG